LNAEENENIKKHMIFCFNILNEIYNKTCDEIKIDLLKIARP